MIGFLKDICLVETRVANLYKSLFILLFYSKVREGSVMPSHGSLSKAGKVRSVTPKLEGKERRSQVPRINNRNSYYKHFILSRDSGQYNPGNRRRKRR
jgi:small subunit ribosomal protein S30e